jgi:hypothetical protein
MLLVVSSISASVVDTEVSLANNVVWVTVDEEDREAADGGKDIAVVEVVKVVVESGVEDRWVVVDNDEDGPGAFLGHLDSSPTPLDLKHTKSCITDT